MGKGLRLEDVTFKFGQLTVLERQSIEVEAGGTLVVTGDNGVGKSTFLQVCAGLCELQGGRVLLGGFEADPSKPSQLVRDGVRRGFVFQDGGLISNLSSLDNVKLPLIYHADVFGLEPEAIETAAREALHRARIFPPDTHALPSHLSFGERKRVALARALAQKSNFVFFDDPDAGLDPDNSRLIDEIVLELREDPEVTTVIATTNEQLMRRLHEPVFELLGGKLIEREGLKVPRLPVIEVTARNPHSRGPRKRTSGVPGTRKTGS